MRNSNLTNVYDATNGFLEIRVHPQLSALSADAAKVFAAAAIKSINECGRFCVCLSGGSTPIETYAILASDKFRSQIPWQHVHVFWGDERCVPPDHPDSLYAMAWKLLLCRVPIPAENVHRMRGEAKNPQDAAAEYEGMLRNFFDLKVDEFPRFDLILLGMGADGHIASLFPGTPGLYEMRRLVLANYVEALRAMRLTMSLPVFNNAAQVMFLVVGESKAVALRSVLSESPEGQQLPAGMINLRRGNVLWLVDRSAAALWIRNRSRSC